MSCVVRNKEQLKRNNSTQVQMSIWFFVLVSLFAVGKSQHVNHNQINQTDLRAAMADMRARSYYGFVMLLKILNSSALNSLETGDVTFFMPNDLQLSEAAIAPGHLQDFILSHSVPATLVLNNLIHFPTGTMIPSGLSNRLLSVTNNGRSRFYINNAKLVYPNVCVSSLIKCHGINTNLEFDNTSTASPETLPAYLHNLASLNYTNKYNPTKYSAIKKIGAPPLQ